MGEHRLCKAGVEGSIPFVSIFMLYARRAAPGPVGPLAVAAMALQWAEIVVESDHVTRLDSRGALEAFFAGRRDATDALALVMCDVIGLKEVNEQDGFGAGDTCLRAAADRLRSAATDADLLARLGGDELVAIFTGPQAAASAERTAANLAGSSTPPLRAAAIVQKQGENFGALVDRLYAIVRRSE